MKAVLLALVVALAAAPRSPQTPPAGLSATGSIEVIVKRSGGAPLGDADVTLSGPPLSSPLKITTGEDGRALFRNLQFGYYGVSAERQGYFWIRPFGAEGSASDSLQLRAAPSEMTNQQSHLFLTPGGIISGKVEDAKGRAYTVSYREDFRTDDLGQFRIFWLPPGEYYLLANREPREADHRDTYSPAVYYPGTTDLIMRNTKYCPQFKE